jgi:hypothetical protein
MFAIRHLRMIDDDNILWVIERCTFVFQDTILFYFALHVKSIVSDHTSLCCFFGQAKITLVAKCKICFIPEITQSLASPAVSLFSLSRSILTLFVLPSSQ